MQRFALLLCSGMLTVLSASAQEYLRFSVDVGGGFTVPAGLTGDYTGWGWNSGAGAGYNFTSRLGAMVDVGYDSIPLNRATISAIGVPGGRVDVLHATLDPVFHLTPHKRFDVYVTAGGGEFRVNRSFSVAYAGPTSVSIPSLGIFASGNALVSSYTVNKPGFDVGAGAAMGAIRGAKIFAEAHWDHVFENRGHLDFLPITFGVRW